MLLSSNHKLELPSLHYGQSRSFGKEFRRQLVELVALYPSSRNYCQRSPSYHENCITDTGYLLFQENISL